MLKKLKIQHLDPVLKRVRGRDGAKVSYSEIMNGWSMIKTDFDLKAAGAKDVKADVFFKFNQVNGFDLLCLHVKDDEHSTVSRQ